MGKLSVVAYKPAPGKEDVLLEILRARVPMLQRLGFASGVDILARSSGGAVVQVSEWLDDEAIERAHESPDVRAMWAQMESCCEFIRLQDLPEAQGDFAAFERL